MTSNRRIVWTAPTFIALTTFLAPLAYVHWTSMWLEFFGRWLVTIWGIIDIRTYWIATFYGINYPFDLRITLGLSYFWVFLGVVLGKITHWGMTKSQYEKAHVYLLCILVVQILLPILAFSFRTDPSIYDFFMIPLPIPSIAALLFLLYDRHQQIDSP